MAARSRFQAVSCAFCVLAGLGQLGAPGSLRESRPNVGGTVCVPQPVYEEDLEADKIQVENPAWAC